MTSADVQSSTVSPNGWIFDVLNLGWDIEQHICTVSSIITALFSVKDWLVNVFPIAF